MLPLQPFPSEHFAENDDVVSILRPISGLLRTENVGQARDEELDSEHIEADRVSDKVREAFRASRHEGDVQAACGGHEVPEL